jgi:FkbM family methyltransferase
MKLIDKIKVFRKTFLTPLKPRKSYSQFAEDLIIENYLAPKLHEGINGFYVDVGSHHPRRGSNTLRLYKAGWKGILIDMEDAKVLAAKMARPRDTVVKAAISDTEELVTVYSPSMFSTNATISNNVISKNQCFSPVSQVVTEKLLDVLEKHNCPKDFDFLSLDIEGNDYKAIKGRLLEVFRPKLICVENHEVETSLEDLIRSKIHKQLVDSKYTLKGISGPSTIYLTD